MCISIFEETERDRERIHVSNSIELDSFEFYKLNYNFFLRQLYSFEFLEMKKKWNLKFYSILNLILK